jgi:folate-binding protein YgfZ
MDSAKSALLPERGVVKVFGEDARTFLNGLLTTDVGQVTAGTARFAALLTPQGKIVLDAIVVEAPMAQGGGFVIDIAKALAPFCVERLNFYKLRARVTVEDLSPTCGVMALWNGEAATGQYLAYRDPRLPALGWRIILPPQRAADVAGELGAELVPAAAYEARRIALGVPRGGLDFAYGDAFPHEADMDQFGGVDFAKGCFVGQEVVSRMEHRGSARNRIVPVAYDGIGPEPGTPVTAGDKAVGTFGSSADGRALAMLRLDRVAEAEAAGHPLVAGAVTLRLVKPDWIRFPLPGASKAEA